MSRRHHGGRSHRQNGHARGPAPLASTQASPRHGQPPVQPVQPVQREADVQIAAATDQAPPESADHTEVDDRRAAFPTTPPPGRGDPARLGPNGHDVPSPAGPAASAGCTAPQLRRFIKSRPYVPMHELRRRFGINGTEDDVTAVQVDGSQVFVGLPAREGGLLGELLRGGEVGYELSLDPRSPVVVGLYPMRPVPRT
jgi:hypothetical protein